VNFIMQGVHNSRIGQTARRSLVDQLVPVTRALREKLFDPRVFTAITFVIFSDGTCEPHNYLNHAAGKLGGF
jgi:hypothetical protein